MALVAVASTPTAEASIDIGDSRAARLSPMVLEFAATVDQVKGERLLKAEHVAVARAAAAFPAGQQIPLYTGLLAELSSPLCLR